jgi:phosphoglycolate phosphatase
LHLQEIHMSSQPEKIVVDLIVFDLDGTLADTLPDVTAAANHASEQLGLPVHVPSTIRASMGGGERKLIERLLGLEHQGRVDDCLKLYLDYYSRHNGELAHLYPGVVSTLERLAGKRLTVLSNKLARLARQTLEAIGIARFFMVIRGGGEGIPLKPAPDQLQALMADMGMKPERTLMVGDKPADIKAGRAAGAFTAALTSGYGDADALAAASPDFLLPRFSQLPYILAD